MKDTYSPAAIRKASKATLLSRFERMHKLKREDLGDMAGLTRDEVRAEIAKLATEFRRRRINVKVEAIMSIRIPVDSFFVDGAAVLEVITI